LPFIPSVAAKELEALLEVAREKKMKVIRVPGGRVGRARSKVAEK